MRKDLREAASWLLRNTRETTANTMRPPIPREYTTAVARKPKMETTEPAITAGTPNAE